MPLKRQRLLLKITEKVFLDESGMCRIYLEDKFIETIDTTTTYTVFLTKYGVGDIYVSDRQPDYFEVTGTPNLTFSWQLLATQRDYNSIRLDEKQIALLTKLIAMNCLK